MKILSSLILFGSLLTPQSFGSTTLFIGDSHSVGYFGQELDRKLRTLKDMNVRSAASCGSIIRWWYKGTPTPCGYRSVTIDGKISTADKAPTPLVLDLLEETKPDLVIIEQGANYIGYPDETLAKDIDRLLTDVEKYHSKCLWVSPPDSRKFREERKILVPKIEKLVQGRCQWFDSLQDTHYPDTGGDGIHYGTTSMKPIAFEWAGDVFKVVESML